MRRDGRRAPEIKWSIFATFILFTTVILMVLWVLQSLLLETFYFVSTRNRMRTLVEDFAAISDEAAFLDRIEDVATEEKLAILCYAVGEEMVLVLLLVQVVNASVCDV